jgi:hypothetical protein
MAHEGRLLGRLPGGELPCLSRREDLFQFFLHGDRNCQGSGLEFLAFSLPFLALVAHHLLHVGNERVALLNGIAV